MLYVITLNNVAEILKKLEMAKTCKALKKRLVVPDPCIQYIRCMYMIFTKGLYHILIFDNWFKSKTARALKYCGAWK